MNEILQKTSNGVNKKLIGQSFFHALGVAVYVGLIALVITSSHNWFGPATDFWGPTLILLLLTLSVAVVGSLIFIRPALWALDGRKKEALVLLFYTLGWLAMMTIIAFIILAKINH